MSSDGDCLFSHGWYEIGRHVGVDVVYIRSDVESYSVSTARHIGLACAAATRNASTVIRVDSSRGRSFSRGKMGQPDWGWLSWRSWFHDCYGEYTCFFGVRLRSEARFRGDSLLAQLRDHEYVFRLVDLCEKRPGWGSVAVPLDGVEVRRRRVADSSVVFDTQRATYPGTIHKDVLLDDLVRAGLSISWRLAWPHLNFQPRWLRLFPEFLAPDIRPSLNLGPAAFEYEGPDFVVPVRAAS